MMLKAILLALESFGLLRFYRNAKDAQRAQSIRRVLRVPSCSLCSKKKSEAVKPSIKLKTRPGYLSFNNLRLIKLAIIQKDKTFLCHSRRIGSRGITGGLSQKINNDHGRYNVHHRQCNAHSRWQARRTKRPHHGHD